MTHEPQCHGVAARGNDKRDQWDQRAVSAGKVGFRVKKAGEQNNEQHRSDDHFKTGVFDDKAVRQAERCGKGTDHSGHHDDLADGGGNRRHPVLKLKTIVTVGQVNAPAFRVHDGQFVVQIVLAACKFTAGTVERFVAGFSGVSHRR